ncbi:HK97 family phage prohead protease [Micromonospora sp. CB01531]|uniref:HK97 family phage prohead protease n=1 Tax=Micromonospora sp. CB01531 TaxID=1718947 RepID=UPI000A8011F7|nr:HK97 family phage prohead protease [Micromonospora sp. CB01531]
MQVKALRGVEIKDADKGTVEAVFSTFNVIDSDKDVTLPGAFQDGAPWKISAYGHRSWMGALPVGKGTVRTTNTEAILQGQFFMDTQHGADTFRTVKAMGDLQEWSYSVHPLKQSFGEFEGQQVRFLEQLGSGEVSPVLAGAGIGTRTLAAKSEGGLLLHEIETALEAMGVVDSAITSASRVGALRAEKGKSLSRVNADALDRLGGELERLREAYAALKSDDPDPNPDEALADQAASELLRAIARARRA